MMLACPFDLRASRASGSVVLAWVSLLRFWPRQSLSALRPAGGGGEPPAGGSASAPGLGWNDLWLAQAWMSVPSTEKCSCDMSALIRACATTAASRRWATSPSSRRSRFLLKVLASHTGASIDRPTNQRNSRL